MHQEQQQQQQQRHQWQIDRALQSNDNNGTTTQSTRELPSLAANNFMGTGTFVFCGAFSIIRDGLCICVSVILNHSNLFLFYVSSYRIPN
jgi:hypothetical protein